MGSGRIQTILDEPAKVARFADVWNAARCPADVATVLGMTKEQVENCREWCRRRGIPIKRFRARACPSA